MRGGGGRSVLCEAGVVMVVEVTVVGIVVVCWGEDAVSNLGVVI